MMRRINRSKRFTAVLHDDRKLLAIFSGMILSAMVFISLLATAGIWFL